MTPEVQAIFYAAGQSLLDGLDTVTVTLPVREPFIATLPDGPSGTVVRLDVTFAAREVRAYLSGLWDVEGREL